MRAHPFFQELSWKEVEEKSIVPPFIPPLILLLLQQNRINCDPTHELEEMIVEPNPLHKKRHRLSKRTVCICTGLGTRLSFRHCCPLLHCQVRTEEEAIEIELNKIENQFRDYNRERDKKTQEEPVKE